MNAKIKFKTENTTKSKIWIKMEVFVKPSGGIILSPSSYPYSEVGFPDYIGA